MFTDLNNDKHVYLQNEQAAETEANGASVWGKLFFYCKQVFCSNKYLPTL